MYIIDSSSFRNTQITQLSSLQIKSINTIIIVDYISRLEVEVIREEWNKFSC